MDIYHDMKKFHTGKNQEGHDQFSIPLEPDKDGMIGRECPNVECEPKYFKMSMTIPDTLSKTVSDFSQADVTCPYCGSVQNMQQFYTQSQIEWIKSMIFRDVTRSFQNMMKTAFKPTRPAPGAMFSISLSYKPGALPSVRHYVEQKLKTTVACEACSFGYAVYGISFHCPLCGKGNLSQHLHSSASIIQVLVEEANRIGNEKGQQVGYQMLGNALEDVVSLFEGFLKHIYKYEINRTLPAQQAEARIDAVRVNFQRLEGAEKFFADDFSYALFGGCIAADRDFLQEQFLKRHVLTHNLGLVDEKYLERAKSYGKQGAELEVSPDDVARTLTIVTAIIQNTIGWMEGRARTDP